MRPNPGTSFPPTMARLIGCLLAATLAILQSGCQKPAAQAAPPPPTVGIVAARKMAVPVLSTTNATTRALQEVVIRARVRGFLNEVHFEEGSFVKKGQLLFVIDELPYQVALQSAQARKSEAEAAVRKAEQSRAREVATAQVALDDAQLNLSYIEERRVRTLLARNAGSHEDVDRAEAARKRYQAQVESDKASLEQSRADYDVAILSAKAQLAATEAMVRDAEINLGYCRMTATIDGRIGEAKFKVGNLVGPDSGGGAISDLATIQQLDPMGVDIRVSSRYLERATRLIKRGLTVELTRPGLEGEVKYPETGECFFIDNMIDPTSSTFLAKARVPNPQATLLPGEYVKMTVVVDRIEDAIVVPEAAVMETEAGPVVYLVDKDGKVAIQRVEAAQAYEGQRVLTSGLAEGASVIVQGLQLVRPGMPVKTEMAVLPRPAEQASPKEPTKTTDATPKPPKTDAPPAATTAVEPGGPRSAVSASTPAETTAAPRSAGGPPASGPVEPTPDAPKRP